MQADSIIEKAKKLGIDPGNGVNQADKLRAIANQLGVEDLTELEETLDRMLQGDQTDQVETLDDTLFEENELEDKLDKDKKQAEDAKKSKEEALQKRNEVKDENKSRNANNGSRNYYDVNRDYRKAKRESKIADKAVKNTQKDLKLNKLNNIKSKMHPVVHPLDAAKSQLSNSAKNVVKTGAKKVGKTVAKGTAQAGKAVGKAAVNGLAALGKLIISNPYVLIALIVIVIIILFLLLVFSGSTSSDKLGLGYYDSSCNYNDTTVNLKTCNSSSTQVMSLEEYVIGTTYSYIQNNEDIDYSDETKKALMITLKTNALSLGNYSNLKKTVDIDDCNKEYLPTSSIQSNDLKKLQSIYKLIEEEIFVSESYSSTISNLSSQSALTIDSEILNQMETLSSSSNYKQILDKVYNKDNNNVTIEDNYRETIFVGDSRMNGMKIFGIVSDNNSVYAGAMGYYWFNGDGGSNADSSTYNCQINGINCVNNKLSNNPTNVVIWLGVNDVTNYEKYYQKYYELANGEWKNHYIYIVSVGYVDDSRSQYAQNSQIKNFNDNMKQYISGSSLSNLTYVDLGYDSTTMANGTTDGVHYGKEFSQKIYDNILNQIGSSTSLNENKKIYKLSNYCTYYSITENDAYWWPIGSSSSTGGNIYGGEPKSVTISSYYGNRTHPVYGTYGFHYGIDIPADAKTPIIATKNGTVMKAIDICTELVEGSGCNGGGGNMVVLDHGDGTSSRYLHMYPGSVEVKVGQQVVQGELIGLVGTTGTSTGNHLHFEILINGNNVNPLDYVDPEKPRPISKYTILSTNDNVESASETKKAICNSLLISGFSKNAVAGMLVNIQAEGAFVLNNLENCYETGNCCPQVRPNYGFCTKGYDEDIYANDISYTNAIDSGLLSKEKFINDEAGYGLVQWTYWTRKSSLYDYAKSQNKSIAALSVQLGFLLEELKGYPETYKHITGNYSAYDTAKIMCIEFENPSEKEKKCPKRANDYADSMLQFVENGCS